MSTTGYSASWTAKFCPQICGKSLNFPYVCIHYDLDIAIASKVVLKRNWLIWKISAIHSWAKPKLIMPITKQKTALYGSIT
ncbi:MAG: hypothetical protein V7K21_25970 [Nostoc sp.]|uniref:hypothetical protein n=1 Tax=Nostoc sp. TaxID=1180 RepID=UPI002FF9644B